jgi:hypothetical protein
VFKEFLADIPLRPVKADEANDIVALKVFETGEAAVLSAGVGAKSARSKGNAAEWVLAQRPPVCRRDRRKPRRRNKENLFRPGLTESLTRLAAVRGMAGQLGHHGLDQLHGDGLVALL